MSKFSRTEGALDEALLRLRVHHLPYRWSATDLKTWEAVCPSCRAIGWDLHIREGRRGGPVTLICSGGRCSDAEIRAALDREPIEPQIEHALALAEQARDIAESALALVTVSGQSLAVAA